MRGRQTRQRKREEGEGGEQDFIGDLFALAGRDSVAKTTKAIGSLLLLANRIKNAAATRNISTLFIGSTE